MLRARIGMTKFKGVNGRQVLEAHTTLQPAIVGRETLYRYAEVAVPYVVDAGVWFHWGAF